MTATITFNLAETNTRDDDLVEFAVVHEGVHVLVDEMAGDGDCADDHEERVCSTIASAFIWTREAGRRDRKKGKKQ